MQLYLNSNQYTLTTERDYTRRLGNWNQSKKQNIAEDIFEQLKLMESTTKGVRLTKRPKTLPQYIIYTSLFIFALGIVAGEAINSDQETNRSGSASNSSTKLSANNNSSVEIEHYIPFDSMRSSYQQPESSLELSKETSTAKDKKELLRDQIKKREEDYKRKVKKEEEAELRSLLTHHPELRKNYKIGQTLFNQVKKMAPQKIDRPDEGFIIESRSDISFISDSDTLNSDKDQLRRIQMKRFSYLQKKNHNELGSQLREELNKEYLDCVGYTPRDSINQHEYASELMDEYASELIEGLVNFQETAIDHALIKLSKVGTIETLTSAVIIEALNRQDKISIESMLLQGVENKSYLFVVIGRSLQSTIEDPRTWGDSSVIVDCWANDKVVSIPQLKKHPEKYQIYLSKGWTWSAKSWSNQSIENLKIIYNQNPNLKQFYNYCLRRYYKMLEQGVDLIV